MCVCVRAHQFVCVCVCALLCVVNIHILMFEQASEAIKSGRRDRRRFLFFYSYLCLHHCVLLFTATFTSPPFLGFFFLSFQWYMEVVRMLNKCFAGTGLWTYRKELQVTNWHGNITDQTGCRKKGGEGVLISLWSRKCGNLLQLYVGNLGLLYVCGWIGEWVCECAMIRGHNEISDIYVVLDCLVAPSLCLLVLPVHP